MIDVSAKERSLTSQDVMIISPIWTYPPLSAGQTAPILSSTLVQKGIKVGYQDYSLDYIGADALEAAANSKIVGMSINTILVPYAFALSDVLKIINPKVKIVFGGYHPTDAPKECFKSKSVDYIVRGEADYSFRDLSISLLNKKIPNNVPGIGFLENGVYKETNPIDFISDLDSMPIPDFGIVDWKKYREQHKSGIHFSRGCNRSCGFCSPSHFWNHTYRQKSAERVTQEYDLLYEYTGIRETRTQGDIFIPKKGWFDKIADFFGDNGYGWDIQTTAGSFDKEDFRYILERGLVGVFSGIEFGSKKMRKRLGKDFDWDRFEKMVSLCNEYDASYDISLLVGYIGETEDTVKDSMDFAKNALDIGVNKVKIFIPSPFPGTSFTNYIVSNCLICSDRVKGYKSVDPSTALHNTGIGGKYLTPERIEELFLDFKRELDRVVAGSNSRLGQEDGMKRGQEKFIVPEHDWGEWEELLYDRLEKYNKIKPPYLVDKY